MLDIVSELYCKLKRNATAHKAAQEIERLRQQLKMATDTITELLWDGALNTAEARINELVQQVKKLEGDLSACEVKWNDATNCCVKCTEQLGEALKVVGQPVPLSEWQKMEAELAELRIDRDKWEQSARGLMQEKGECNNDWISLNEQLTKLREMQGEPVGVVVDTYDGYTKVRMLVPQPSGTLLYVSTPSRETSDQVCEEADGCPTELAVLKRFWRDTKQAQQDSAIAWETGSGNGLVRYVTDARYQKFSDTIKQYYRPYTGKASTDD